MRAFLVLASLVMLVSAEPPTSYSHRSSGPNLSFQPVPSVAQIHIPSTSSQSSSSNSQYAAPSSSNLHQTSYASASQNSPSYAAPQSSYGSPSQSSSQYQAPIRNQQQQQQYNAPQQQQQYGAPEQQYQAQSSYQQNQYSAPSSSYQSQSSPANIQVSYGGAPPPLPPGASYGPPPVVTGAGPDHDIEYRVVYVKGPKARQPDLVLPPPPPKQKTIVYILVPRVEAPEPIIVPTHAPTPPSKPEVYFIRYKAAKKSRPSGQYGAPSAPKPVVVAAPSNNKKREVEVSVTSSSSKETKDVETASTFSFGDRVPSSTN